MTVVDGLIENQRAELVGEPARREVPRIPTGQVTGQTPEER